jgi:hypothetical protein
MTKPAQRSYKERMKEDVIIDGKNFGHLLLASDIEPKDVEWLWFPYIPYGAASLLFGPGGMGKSHIAVDIVSHLTRGEPLPGMTERPNPQNVLMLSAEDDFDKVLVPRLMKAGADLDRVAFPPEPFVLSPAGVKALSRLLDKFDASVVFIDPIVHYIGSKIDMNKANEVRGAIGVFHQLAMKNNSAIILVGHSRKGNEGEDYDKAMGSADFNNAVRSVLYVSKTPDGLGKIMKHVKANYSALGPSLGYDFGHNGAGSFEWTGEVEGPDLGGPPMARRRSKKRSLVDFLRSWLANGPLPSRDIEQMARDEGINDRTIQRAKIEAGVESFMVWRAGKPVWYMRLHGDQTEIPSVDDGDEIGTGRHTLVRPTDGGEVHPQAAGGNAEPSGTVDAGGSGRGTAGAQPGEPAKPDAKAIAAAFLSLTVGGAQ